MENIAGSRFLQRALVVGFYAVAMAYLEAAVVVYIQRALKIDPLALFPLQNQAPLGALGAIEIGREIATLVMLATVGGLAGRNALDRLAWTAVAFGIWDIGYYLWLWVFIGWPTNLGTYDLLFLIPVPWVAPVSAPMAVSLALISFGLVVSWRVHGGENLRVKLGNFVLLAAGGLVVIFSFTLDAGRIQEGGTPSTFPWPIFAAGMTLAICGAVSLSRSK